VTTYGSADVVIVGGGIAGSALATVLAHQGIGVTVLERQTEYHDRVRGEVMVPWGMAEARRLGLDDVFLRAGGIWVTRRIPYDETIPPHVAETMVQDVPRLFPDIPGFLDVRHPAACRALADAAISAGACFLTGTGAVKVTAGQRPSVAFEHEGAEHRLSCRLVVAADGRASSVRSQAGITLNQTGPTQLISGLLIDGVPDWPQDAYTIGTEGEIQFYVFPQGGQRVRLYTTTSLDQRERYAGPDGAARFLDDFRRLTCMPLGASLANGTPIGPCATLAAPNTWTDVPFVDGVVLQGDAAGYSDPNVGQGLSMALRDTRILSELLLSQPDWSPAGLQPYAVDRYERMRRVRFLSTFFADLQATFGPAGAARRARFFRCLAEPDFRGVLMLAVLHGGPEQAPDWAYTEEFRAEVLGDLEDQELMPAGRPLAA
jgi:2-polyprenyl-6-methoxyphenol hydroxylase-like FAD-dependent oxidoreductase